MAEVASMQLVSKPHFQTVLLHSGNIFTGVCVARFLFLFRSFYQFTLTARVPSRFSSASKSSAPGVTAHFGAGRNSPYAVSLL